MNRSARAVMFLLRHTIELLLKNNFNNEVPTTHNIKELSELLELENLDDSVITKHLDFRNEGDSLRYYNNNKGEPFYNHKDKINLKSLIDIYNSKYNTLKGFKSIFHEVELSKMQNWNLTFHLNEASSLRSVCNEYETLIERVLTLINEAKIDIDKCYLPVYYLIRHTLELSLKVIIYEARTLSSEVKKKKIDQEHSIQGLLNIYVDYLTKVNSGNLSDEVKIELKNYIYQSKGLVEKIHELDSNSIGFRFPFDKNGVSIDIKATKYSFYELICILKEINVFLIFSNIVIAEENAHV